MEKMRLPESLIGESIIFIFNGYIIKNLKLKETVGELYIKNDSTIVVFDQNNIIGAGGPVINFVDVSSNIVKKLEFSEDDPKWREVCKG